MTLQNKHKSVLIHFSILLKGKMLVNKDLSVWPNIKQIGIRIQNRNKYYLMQSINQFCYINLVNNKKLLINYNKMLKNRHLRNLLNQFNNHKSKSKLKRPQRKNLLKRPQRKNLLKRPQRNNLSKRPQRKRPLRNNLQIKLLRKNQIKRPPRKNQLKDKRQLLKRCKLLKNQFKRSPLKKHRNKLPMKLKIPHQRTFRIKTKRQKLKLKLLKKVLKKMLKKNNKLRRKLSKFQTWTLPLIFQTDL